MLIWFPALVASKGIGRYAFAACSRFKGMATNVHQYDESFFDISRSEGNKVDEKLGKNANFKNVSLITPKIFARVFYNEFKIKFVDEREKSKAGIELLRNIAAKYDYWMVRSNQELLLYYRLEMMMQRINFLKSVGLDSKQKLRQIQKQPPLLLFTFTDCSYTGKLIYLRGLLPKEKPGFIHLFYPVTNKVTANKRTIEKGIRFVEEALKIKQPAVIRELLNLPCFFMDPSRLSDIEHMFIHKYSMPYFYNLDKHSVNVLPPIADICKVGLSAEKHFVNTANKSIIASLPTYQMNDILDYNYPTCNGKGSPECLTTFLVRAELEEEKDRTGGQPLKGRRGFNMPPRQY